MDIINKETRRELLSALRERYRLAVREAKGRILDEFVEVSGLHRKNAVRPFRTKASAASKDAPVGRRVYDEATRQALILIWEAADRICGKRLKAIIPDLLTATEKHGHLKLDGEVRQRVESASAATIDRLLRSVRKSAGSRRRKRPGKRMTREIPVKTCHDWHDPQPGYLEIDFVVHSGGSMAGEYLHSLVADRCLLRVDGGDSADRTGTIACGRGLATDWESDAHANHRHRFGQRWGLHQRNAGVILSGGADHPDAVASAPEERSGLD